jgi:tRNA (cytidine/uridine-2'-O-)-methyltransferase
MFNLILYEPEIPPNTGNIIRLCANVGASLHLIEPLGFRLEDRLLRRAGLDYHEWVAVQVHASLEDCLVGLTDRRVYALSTRGRVRHDAPKYRPGDCFLFGPESRGLPLGVLDRIAPDQRLRIPMRPGNRSLNLSNAAAVVVFEAWRQFGFSGADAGRPTPV